MNSAVEKCKYCEVNCAIGLDCCEECHFFLILKFEEDEIFYQEQWRYNQENYNHDYGDVFY